MTPSELEQKQDTPEEGLREGQAEGVSQADERATERQPVNLDDLPEFRQWKSTMDRKLAEETRERERLKKELEEHRKKVDELSLKDAPPEERERYYRNRVTQLEEEQKLQADRQAKMAAANQRAIDFLSTLGLTPETPGLDWGGDPLADGFERLALSAAKLASSTTRSSQEQVEAKTREAKQEALKESGVPRVSTATSEGASDLERAYQKELGALRGSGNFRAFVELKKKYREKGLQV